MSDEKRLIAIQDNLPECKMYLEGPPYSFTLRVEGSEIKNLNRKTLLGIKTLIEDVLWMNGRYPTIKEDDE